MLAYLRADFAGRDAQDDAVQDRQPEQARDLDHPRIGEELGEVAPHRLGRRLVGRAEVADQDRGLRGVPWAKAGSGAKLIAPTLGRPQGLSPNSNGAWRCVSANFITSKRTHGLTGSLGGVPRPMTPAPCRVQAPRRRLMISGSLSKRT